LLSFFASLARFQKPCRYLLVVIDIPTKLL
jgi:hypothetical protein